MGEPALHLTESPDNSYSGFGKNVVKLSNTYGSTVCIIGEHDQVWFPRAVTFDELAAVAEILHKKKMRKALDHGNFEKAQHFADRKFDPPSPPPPPVRVISSPPKPPPQKLPKRDKSGDEEEERRLDELIARQMKTMPGRDEDDE